MKPGSHPLNVHKRKLFITKLEFLNEIFNISRGVPTKSQDLNPSCRRVCFSANDRSYSF